MSSFFTLVGVIVCLLICLPILVFLVPIFLGLTVVGLFCIGVMAAIAACTKGEL